MSENDNKNLNPVIVAIAGIALGAAGATAIALSDQETRKLATKKAREVTKHLKTLSINTLQQMQNESKIRMGINSPLDGLDKVNHETESKKIEVTKSTTVSENNN